MAVAVAPSCVEEPTILRYDARIVPNLDTRSIAGETTLKVQSQRGRPWEIRLPSGSVIVDSVRIDGETVPFRTVDRPAIEAGTLQHRVQPHVAFVLPTGAGAADLRRVTIAYHAEKAEGLVFGDRFVYSDFFTCRWMLCRETSGDKAEFGLELLLPEKLSLVASGSPITKEPAG